MTFYRFAPLLIAAVAGCGGIGPGDYLVYRIAFQDTARSPDCYGGQVPVDELDDSSSLYASGTFILYVGTDDTYFLDIGDATLRGKDKGDQRYEFSGSTVDTEVQDEGGLPTTTTTTLETNVTFDVEGEVVEGVFERASSFSCTGPQCPDPDTSTCTETTPFVGGEVADLELEHEV